MLDELNTSRPSDNSAGLSPDWGSALGIKIAEAPIYGVLEALGSFTLQTVHGDFEVHGFESLSNQSFVLALSQGDISSDDQLTIRLHSECITSETLCGCDCDCAEQLDKALAQIAEEGRGVLFYLFQEGRGAGYTIKSRDRMGVMSSNNQINTFDAYEEMGLPQDARSYEMLPGLRHLLGIAAPVRVLTNNPAKLAALEQAGIQFRRDEISVVPNPHNAHYLKSKIDAGGHLITTSEGQRGAIPWDVEVFQPYRLTAGAARFVHTAAYPLPIRPMQGLTVLPPEAIDDFKDKVSTAFGELSGTFLLSEKLRSSGELLVQFNDSLLTSSDKRTRELSNFIAQHPLWFNDLIYHDTLLQRDFVVLQHGSESTEAPLVRIHSENYLQRFPLAYADRSTSYQRSVRAIVENGNGTVVLYPEDGNGHGFGGAFLRERLLRQGVVDSKEEADAYLGNSGDARDYGALARLVKLHYGSGPIRLIFTAEDTEEHRERCLSAIDDAGIEQLWWKDLDE